MVMLNPYLTGFGARQHLGSFSYISQIAQSSLDLTRDTVSQLCQSARRRNVDKVFAAISPADIHLNRLVFFDNSSRSHRISHGNFQGTRIIIGRTSWNESQLGAHI